MVTDASVNHGVEPSNYCYPSYHQVFREQTHSYSVAPVSWLYRIVNGTRNLGPPCKVTPCASGIAVLNETRLELDGLRGHGFWGCL